jgi:hypothetical protein
MSRLQLILPILLLFVAAGVAGAEVTITKTDVVVEYKKFDPKKPPSEMPRLQPPEAAVTVSFFGADTRVGGSVSDSRVSESGTTEASVLVDTVKMTLRMRITVWLPTNGNAKIEKHEEGHRQLAEFFYKDAQDVAKRLADAMMGQTITGRGSNTQEASTAALQQANTVLGKQYLESTDAPCFKAQQIFDRITAHGTNALKEEAAMKQAIMQVRPELLAGEETPPSREER